MFLSHLIGALRQWRRYNQSLRELNRLGDRELADIGLTRSERWVECNKRFWQA